MSLFDRFHPTKKEKPVEVYLGVPTHEGKLIHGLFSAIYMAGKSLSKTQIENGSALTTNFNKLWCAALNCRKLGITHFCMVHSDVWPREPGWLDKMVSIMDKFGADVLSAVIQLKDHSGVTSTAIEIPDPTQHNGFRAEKIKLSDALTSRPSTFTDPMLLINTGLMLVDLQNEWVEKVWFEFRDSIQKNQEDGMMYPVSLSEDYGFSRMVRLHGGRLFATTEIALSHMGNGKFDTQRIPAPAMAVV